MKPDTIATPDTSGFEELVPSRYALRIGDIDVLVVSDGVLPLPTETMATNVDPAVRAEWFKDMFVGPDMFDWALRSEEHTSELQSLMRISYAVFCLKKQNKPHMNT